MIDKQKQKLNMKVQWAKFAVVLALYLLFLVWVESWLGLIVVPFIFDVYITKKIHWQWWKDEEGPVRYCVFSGWDTKFLLRYSVYRQAPFQLYLSGFSGSSYLHHSLL